MEASRQNREAGKEIRRITEVINCDPRRRLGHFCYTRGADDRPQPCCASIQESKGKVAEALQALVLLTVSSMEEKLGRRNGCKHLELPARLPSVQTFATLFSTSLHWLGLRLQREAISRTMAPMIFGFGRPSESKESDAILHRRVLQENCFYMALLRGHSSACCSFSFKLSMSPWHHPVCLKKRFERAFLLQTQTQTLQNLTLRRRTWIECVWTPPDHCSYPS